ncbi:MAG: hypothetical protein R3F61_26840 [Myxococcota bacterium]
MRALIAFAALLVSPVAFAQNLVETDAASLVWDYEWENASTTQIADGTVTFTFDTVVDNTLNSRCNNGWAANLCRVGTFETSDGGTGTARFVVNGSSLATRRQIATLVYDVTDARYSRTLFLTGGLWTGTMTLPSDSDWAGVFVENITAPVMFAPAAAFADTVSISSGRPHGNGNGNGNGRGNGRGRGRH